MFLEFDDETQSGNSSRCQGTVQCWTPSTSPVSTFGHDSSYVSNCHNSQSILQPVTSPGCKSTSMTCVHHRVTPSTDAQMTSSNGNLMTSSIGKLRRLSRGQLVTLSHDNLLLSAKENLVTSSKGRQVTSSQGQLMTSLKPVCPLCNSRYPDDDCRDGFCASVWDNDNSLRSLHL